MTSIILSSLVCFVIGYGLGLFIDRWDKRIKNGGR
jgi:hypothetical protein